MNSRRLIAGWFCIATLLTPCWAGDVADSAKPQSDETSVRFEQRLSDEEYAKRSQELTKERDELDQLAETEQPAEGTVLSQLAADGYAKMIGMELGDIIHSIDDQILWTSEPAWKEEYDEQQIKIVYYDRSENRIRSVQKEGRVLGVNYHEYWNPGLTYLRDQTSRGAWDEHLLNACLHFETDPVFAEEALSRAEQAGAARNYHLIQLGIVASLLQNLPERAGALLKLLDWSDEEQAKKYHPSISLRAAFANNDLDSIRLIETVSPISTATRGERLSLIREYIARRNEQVGKTPLTVPPGEVAPALYRDDLLPHCQARTRDSLRGFLKAVRSGEPFRETTSPGSYRFMVIGTDYPVNDVEMRMKFTLAPNGTERNRWQKCLKVSLKEDWVLYPELESADSNEAIMIRVAEQINDPQVRPFIHVSVNGYMIGFGYCDGSFNLDGKQEIDLRVLRVQDMCEIQLNGNRILWLPLTTTVSLNPNLQPIGVDVNFKSFSFAELIPQVDP